MMFEDNLNILYILIIIIHNRGNWGRLKSKIQIMLMINKGLNLSLNITQFVIKARSQRQMEWKRVDPNRRTGVRLNPNKIHPK